MRRLRVHKEPQITHPGDVIRNEEDRQWYFEHPDLLFPAGPYATKTGCFLALKVFLTERGIYE